MQPLLEVPGGISLTEYAGYVTSTFAVDRYLGQRLNLIAAKPETWLDDVHPEFSREARKWAYARDHYTGQCADAEKIRYYLVRKALDETIENYEERVQLADYTPHMGTLIDEMAGMLFLSDDDTEREWGDLGDPEDTGSIAGMLSADADESGNPWETIWKLLNIELTGIHRAWIFVDGGATETAAPHVMIVPPEIVRNWRYDEDGVLQEALIAERMDTRASLQDPGTDAISLRYLHLFPEGWQRYKKVKTDSGEAQVVALTGPGDRGQWEFFTRSGVRTIPLYRAELPLRRHLGYALARKANAIFNQESARDNLIRFANFPILNIIGNDKTYNAVVKRLAEGARAIQSLPGTSAHHFIAPQSQPAQLAGTVLERKVTEFYRVGFKSFEEIGSNRERLTATEIKSRLAGGIYAFLILQKTAVEDAENAVLYFVEQTVFKGKRASWGKAHVTRSNNFTPPDVDTFIEQIRKRYFGDSAVVPVGKQGRIAAAKQIAEWDGIEIDENEIAADVDMVELEKVLKDVPAFLADLGLPPEATAELVVKFCVATGIVQADPTTQTGQLKLDQLRSLALAMANKKQEQADQAAEAAATPPAPATPATKQPPPGSGGGQPPQGGGAPKPPAGGGAK